MQPGADPIRSYEAPDLDERLLRGRCLRIGRGSGPGSQSARHAPAPEPTGSLRGNHPARGSSAFRILMSGGQTLARLDRPDPFCQQMGSDPIIRHGNQERRLRCGRGAAAVEPA